MVAGQTPGELRQLEVEGGGESLSGSTTDDLPNDETNLLPTSAPDNDCVHEFPLDIIRPVDNLGEGIFGEVSQTLSPPLLPLCVS